MKKPLPLATAMAPACVGNVAVGFDFLGHTINDPGDRATVRRIADSEVRITAVRGVTGHIPLSAEKNTAGVALIALRRRLNLDFGFEVELDKGIPWASGMGGSAASCVAALVAANAVMDTPAPLEMLYQCALDGESLASGARNGDNVGPMLYGGLVIATPERVVPVPVPQGLYCVLAHPDLQVNTLRARAPLEEPFALADVVRQTANLALLLSGCYRHDFELIRAGLHDCLIEPRRATLIPGFHDVKQAALESGALGAGISGAGPS
ncbi:MAG: homoserine kinase, partial [Gammaproteobacteria bacterium]